MFHKATRRKARLRLALSGPEGTGKTMTALRIGMALLPPDGRLALIDTEHGSASLYAGSPNPDGAPFDFDHARLDTERGMFSVENYIRAIKGAADAGYPVLIVDSLSHAWSGQGGILEFVDRQSGSTFSNGWKKASPLQHKLIDALLSYPGHLICTMRVKSQYVIEINDKGKSAPRKIGLAPVQRDSVGYEFTVVAELDQDKRLTITKTRCSAIDGATFEKAGADLAGVLLEWLETGENRQDDRWHIERDRFLAALESFGCTLEEVTAEELAADKLHPSEAGTEGRRAIIAAIREAQS